MINGLCWSRFSRKIELERDVHNLTQIEKL